MLDKENEILIFPQKSNWRYVCLIQSRKDEYIKMQPGQGTDDKKEDNEK